MNDDPSLTQEPSAMSTQEAKGTPVILWILLFAFIAAVWIGEKLIGLFLALGIVFSFLPDAALQWFVSLPILHHAGELIVWFAENALKLCLVLTLIYVLRLKNSVGELEESQQKQDMMLGGIGNYIEATDLRLPDAAEELKSIETVWDFVKLKLRTSFISVLLGRSLGPTVAGTDPYQTQLKRRGEIITLQRDIRENIAP